MLAALIFLLMTASEQAPASVPEAPPPASEQARPASADDKGRLVCRRETKPNTRFTSKTCKTVEEWEERSKTAQDSFEDVRGRTMTVICPPVGGCD